MGSPEDGAEKDEKREGWRLRSAYSTCSFCLDLSLPESVVPVGEEQAVLGAGGQALELVKQLGRVHLLRLLPLAAICRST